MADDEEQQMKAMALEVFQALDTDGSGSLEVDEISEIVEPESCEEVMGKLDPNGTGEVSFIQFFEGFSIEDAPMLGGALIKMDVIQKKVEDRANNFASGLGDEDGGSDNDETDLDEDQAREKRFAKILEWMKGNDQMVGAAEVDQSLQFVCKRAFTPEELQALKNMFLSKGFSTVKCSAIAVCIIEAKRLETKKSLEDDWSNDRFISTLLERLDKGIAVQGGSKDPTKELQKLSIEDLTQSVKELQEKNKRLNKEVEKHQKNANRLDDENQGLREKLGKGSEGRSKAQQLERERAEQLRTYEEMVDKLQGAKQTLESDLKDLRQEHQNDRALLKNKQTMIKNSTSELKNMKKRMEGLLQQHAEKNKAELKKKVCKMTAIMARRRFIRELQVDNERIPQLEVENVHLKETVAKLQEEAKEYLRVMASYNDSNMDLDGAIPTDDPEVEIGLVIGDEEEIEALRKRLQEEVEKNGKLREQLDDTMNLLEEEKQGRESAEAKAKTLEEQKETLLAQKTEFEANVTKLEGELEAEKAGRKADVEKLEGTISGLEEKISELEKKLAEERAAREALEKELSLLGDDSQTKIAEMTKEIAELKKRVKELEDELGAEKTKREAVEAELGKVKAELESEQVQRKKLEDELGDIKGQLDEAESKITELEDILQTKECEVVTIIEAKVFVEATAPTTQEVGIKLNPDQQAELSAYARCFNKTLGKDQDVQYLMPINESNPELLLKLKDGILIAKFINTSVPGTIDQRALNMPAGAMAAEQMLENLTMSIGSAKSIGVAVQDDEALIEALLNPTTPGILLGFLFNVVKTKFFQFINVRQHEEILELCEPPENTAGKLKLKAIQPEDLEALDPPRMLMRWVNWHICNSATKKVKEVKDWGDHLCDARAYESLLTIITNFKKASAMPDKTKTDGKRARHCIDKADHLKIEHFHLPNNITGGSDRMNMLLVACLFCHSTALGNSFEDSTSALGKSISNEKLSDELREARIYRMWINSLGIENCFVTNLFVDMSNGIKCLKLIDFICPGTVAWNRAEKDPVGKIKKTTNGNLIIAYCKKQLGLKEVSTISGENLVEGKPMYILPVMSALMRWDIKKKLSTLGVSGGDPEKAILDWSNAKIKAKKRDQCPISVLKDFSDKKLSNSYWLINVLYTVAPKVVKWNEVKTGTSDNDKQLNARYVISLARKMGADVYLLPHDIVDVKKGQILLFVGSMMLCDKKK